MEHPAAEGRSASASAGALIAPAAITAAGALLPRRREALATPSVLSPAALAWEDGVLTYVGPPDGLPATVPHVRERGLVIPGFVDAHTHLPFAGWRADEYELRLAGKTYRDLHGEGGIYRSSRQLAETSDEDVIAFGLPLMAEMAAHGTTAVELKTGYGLSVEAELRQARLARALAREAPQTCVVTLLACHAVPRDRTHEGWVRAVCEELIPAAVAEALVDAVDVYVEDIAFTLEDLEAVAEAASEAGLALRVHADQLGPSGAAEAAVRLGARSADHLNHVGEEGIRALATGAGTAATLLPPSTFTLQAGAPPARELADAGAPIVVATDLNPGTSPCLSMPEAVAMACTLYRLTPLEALTAATANAAWSLGLGDRLGTLEPGKRADFLVLDVEEFREVPYRPGHNPVRETYISGHRVAPG